MVDHRSKSLPQCGPTEYPALEQCFFLGQMEMKCSDNRREVSVLSSPSVWTTIIIMPTKYLSPEPFFFRTNGH